MIASVNRNALIRFIAALLTVAASVVPARADNVQVTYSSAGQTGPDIAALCAGATVCDYGMENFSAWTGSRTFVSKFNDAGTGTFNTPNGASFTGTYAAGPGTTTGYGGEWIKQAQNIYGGVSGAYPELFGPPAVGAGSGTASYTLSLTSIGVPGINYFGLWISALDPYNNLTVYDGSNLIAQFDSATLLAQLGTCPGSDYCGNPTAAQQGADSGELFAFVNIFDLTGFITKVIFSNNGSSGFESANHTVAYIDPVHALGTPVNTLAVPEPGAVAVFGVALVSLGMLRHRRPTR